MLFIAPDERRGSRPKGPRRFAVATGSALNIVAPIRRATSTPLTTRLASELPVAITAAQNIGIML